MIQFRKTLKKIKTFIQRLSWTIQSKKDFYKILSEVNDFSFVIILDLFIPSRNPLRWQAGSCIGSSRPLFGCCFSLQFLE